MFSNKYLTWLILSLADQLWIGTASEITFAPKNTAGAIKRIMHRIHCEISTIQTCRSFRFFTRSTHRWSSWCSSPSQHFRFSGMLCSSVRCSTIIEWWKKLQVELSLFVRGSSRIAPGTLRRCHRPRSLEKATFSINRNTMRRQASRGEVVCCRIERRCLQRRIPNSWVDQSTLNRLKSVKIWMRRTRFRHQDRANMTFSRRRMPNFDC